MNWVWALKHIVITCSYQSHLQTSQMVGQLLQTPHAIFPSSKTNAFFSCVCSFKVKWSLCSQCTSACATFQNSLAVTIFVLSSFSFWQGDSEVESWRGAKRGRPAVQLKLLQAKQEETEGAIETEKKKKSETDIWALFFLSLCPSLPLPSYFLFKPNYIALLHWQGVGG